MTTLEQVAGEIATLAMFSTMLDYDLDKEESLSAILGVLACLDFEIEVVCLGA